MNLPKLILASASPRRSALLRQMGMEFVVVPAKAEEVQPEHLSPHEIAQINAYRKARAVAKRYPDSLILGADTIVCLGDQIFGKPRDHSDARRMLAALSGHTHQVVTGVCLVHLRRHRQKVFAASTDVTFRVIQEDIIQAYLSKVNPLDKAGAYAIQDQGDTLVDGIKGSFNNVVGLPTECLRQELRFWELVR